jgi:hypothetical protein
MFRHTSAILKSGFQLHLFYYVLSVITQQDAAKYGYQGGSILGDKSRRGVKLNAHLHLVTRLGITAAVSTLPHVFMALSSLINNNFPVH